MLFMTNIPAQRFQIVQYSAVLATAGSIKDSFREKSLNELELEYHNF